jgi:hypothetical protein
MGDLLLRYVVLRHDGINDPHFDLMLELTAGAALATWRLPVWPLGGRARVIRLADHRRDYLDYEGPVSGNRGTVSRVASGTHQLSRDPDFNDDRRWSWEIRFEPPAVHPDILLRRWLDSGGRELWDVSPM